MLKKRREYYFKWIYNLDMDCRIQRLKIKSFLNLKLILFRVLSIWFRPLWWTHFIDLSIRVNSKEFRTAAFVYTTI